MASNPFLSWPLWHSFTLHFQNVDRNTDTIRQRTLPRGGIPLHGSDLEDDVGPMAFYDFMADRIVNGSSVSNVRLLAITELMTDQSYTQGGSNENMVVIVKGVAQVKDGRIVSGDFAPYVGAAQHMRILVSAIASAIRGDPIQDKLAPLTRMVNPLRLRENPNYGAPIIRSILESYDRPTRAPRDDQKVIQRITTNIRKVIHDNKAINLDTGMYVSLGLPRYSYHDYNVKLPGDGVRKNVRFAIPSNKTVDERAQYIRMLETTFDAQPVTSSQVSEEDRRAIEIQPVRLTQDAYLQLFPGLAENFNTYLNPVAIETTQQIVDPGQTLHSEAFVVEDEDDYFEEDLDDI